MFKKKNYRKVVISILAVTMMFGTVALASEGISDKKVTATYGRIKFNYKGNDVTKIIENQYGTPAFTVDGRAYAPVRAMADLLGVDIDYDNATHTAKITDIKLESHKKELDSKNKELEEKNKKIEELEKELKKLKDGTVDKEDLKSLQTSLNKKYGEYEKVEFDITLKESKDNVSVDISTDLKDGRDEQNWIRMRYADKKSLIEDIVSEVRKSFVSSDVTGSVYDSFSRKDLYTFSQKKNGSLSISDKDYISGGGYNDRYDDRYGYRGLDSFVEKEFDYYDIENARIYRINSSNWDESFEISFSSDYEKKWDALTDTNSKIESMLDRIAREIEYDSNYGYDIRIDILMGDKVVGTYTKYDRDSYGTFR